MSDWIRARDCPQSWEGEEVWQWNEWSGNRPFWNVVPRGFSRDPHHCRGVWYMKFTYPAWPSIEVQAAAVKADEALSAVGSGHRSAETSREKL